MQRIRLTFVLGTFLLLLVSAAVVERCIFLRGTHANILADAVSPRDMADHPQLTAVPCHGASWVDSHSEVMVPTSHVTNFSSEALLRSHAAGSYQVLSILTASFCLYVQAAKHINLGRTDTEGRWSVFGQAFRQV